MLVRAVLVVAACLVAAAADGVAVAAASRGW